MATVNAFINAARQSGYTDEQINAFLNQQQSQPTSPEGIRQFITDARQEGFSDQEISGFLAEIQPESESAAQQFFDNPFVNTGFDVLNIPSFAVGGVLKESRESSDLASRDPVEVFGTGAAKGIAQGFGQLRDEPTVMRELPASVGVDPASPAGLAIGFAGELATPGLPFDEALKGTRFAKQADNAPALTRVSDDLAKRSDDVLTRGLGSPQTQANLAARTGEDVPSMIKRFNLFSRDPDEARALKVALLDEFDDLAVKSKKTVSKRSVEKSFNKAINKQARQAGQSDEAANAVRDLISRKNKFLKAYPNEQIPVGEITKLKKIVTRDISPSKIGLGTKAAGKSFGAEQARGIFRESASRTNPRLRQLGKDLQKLGDFGPGSKKGLIDILDSSAKRGVNRRAFSLGRVATTGVGGFIGGIPGSVAAVIGDITANSPRTIKAQSKLFSALSRGVKGLDKPAQLFSRIPKQQVVRGTTTGARLKDEDEQKRSKR